MKDMSSTTVSVRIDPVIKKRLEKLAKSTGRSRSFLAAEAINEYLDLNEWQVAGIQRAVASLDRGEGVSHERVKEWVSSWNRKKSDRLLNARRHEHPVVARGNRRPELASSLHRARQSVRRARGRASHHA